MIEDTVFNETIVNTIYTIEVVSDKNGFDLKYVSKTFDVEADTMASNQQTFMDELLEYVKKDMEQFSYVLRFDPELGVITEMLNEDDFVELFEKTMTEFIAETTALEEDQKKEFKEYLPELILSIKDNYIQTSVNGANLMLQGYSYPYKKNGSYTTESIYYEADAMTYSNIEIPSMLTISSKTEGTKLSVNSSMDVDKEEMLKVLQRQGKAQDLTKEEFEMTIKDSYVFDLESSWIEKFEAETSVVMAKTVKVIMMTSATFSK